MEGDTGYIDRTGRFAIKPAFQHAESFSDSDGLAVVNSGLGGNKCGFIDRSGKFVLGPSWDWGEGFRDGIAFVRPGNSDWMIIDRDGKKIELPGGGRLGVRVCSEGLIPSAKVSRFRNPALTRSPSGDRISP